MLAIHVEPRRIANRMVEESMIAANICAGRVLGKEVGYGIFAHKGRRRYTNSLKIVYRTETNGMKISIPTIPIRLPPIVTAASTQIDGSPTEFPTTCG